MTDSMNFGPEWLRNLSSDGSTTGGTGGAVRYQLSGYRYGREEMLGLYEKGFKPPASLSNFTTLYSEQPLIPLVLTPTTEEERMWQNRPPPINPSVRGSRGSSLERGGRGGRGRGGYNSYGRNVGYENAAGPSSGWGNGEQQEWSPRKDYSYSRSASVDNWRRNARPDEDDGWRAAGARGGGTSSIAEKWGRSTSWRDGDKEDDRGGPQHDRNNRNWHDGSTGRGGIHNQQRRAWEDDHPQPEWFTEQVGESGGTFDSSGAYHGSDDEQDRQQDREQHRGGTPGRKELQKSASQQNISPRQPPSLSSSKSSGSLNKHLDNDIKEEMVLETSMKDVQDSKDRQDPPEKFKSDSDRLNANEQKLTSASDRRDNNEMPLHKVGPVGSHIMNINGIISDQGLTNRVEEDFDRLQEDLVSKLVVEEESPKPSLPASMNIPGVGVVSQQPPPNLVPPIQDKWYYQDPQGELQGPFVSTEMAEWFKAGYFTLSLLVRRRCDNSFYSLGDLVNICNGNPFLSTMIIPPLKEAPQPTKKDMLNMQYLQAQMALRQVAPRAYNPAEWASLSAVQQRDLLSQHMMPQQHPQMSPVDLQYLQQPPQPTAATNPLMHMISQMQQVNKLPGQTLSDQQQNSLPMQLDPLQALVQQMSLQRIQPTATSMPGMGLPPNIPSDNIMAMAGVHGTLPVHNLSGTNITGLAGGIPGHSGPVPGPVSQTSLEGITIPNDENPINTLLRQLQSKNIQASQSIDSLWQQNQFVPPQTQSNNQWPQQQQQQQTQQQQQQQQKQQAPPTQPPQNQQPIQSNDAPLSMWDLPQSSIPKPNIQNEPSTPSTQQEEPPQPAKEKETSRKEKEREERKKKEQEEKQQKKEAEEKRKQEQRRQELEKKAAEDKKRKEEDRIKKELEKAKKEAEEKRQRELEEKRRAKEQRKAEEDARKKAEELKKLEEQDRERQREEQARRQAEMVKQSQESNSGKVGKVAPWSQANVNSGPSLADIQKAERERRLAEAVVQQQQRAQQIQEQQTIEKASIQLSWANKPLHPRQVKSLAEIQAEEQEKLAKQAAERLAQQQREKESNTTSVSTGIWQGQNLTWANTASQWSTTNNSGFWDDIPSPKAVSKPSNIVKSNSSSAMTVSHKQPQQQQQQQQQPPKQVKVKTKKEEPHTTVITKNNMNGPATEEFTAWCIRALSNVTSTVDIPTFIGFLKDIESAAEVKDYCRDYLGESPAMHQFMQQFLEKRRSFRPKLNAHKDDMCSPAPAITPSSQHNNEFQEVKGKGKKCKKSKMTRVDARILGFNVTAAQDRINVGDRDYGDN